MNETAQVVLFIAILFGCWVVTVALLMHNGIAIAPSF